VAKTTARFHLSNHAAVRRVLRELCESWRRSEIPLSPARGSGLPFAPPALSAGQLQDLSQATWRF
jgi:hypothetical protein